MKNLIALSFTLFAGCAATPTSDPTADVIDRVTCNLDADCATTAAGGSCEHHQCHATNECRHDTDCPTSSVCVTAAHFGGLCAHPGDPAEPLPAPVCVDPPGGDPTTASSSTGATGNAPGSCPPGTECGAGAQCHKLACIDDGDCPSGLECHEQCTTAAATTHVGGVCEPPGVGDPTCDPVHCFEDSQCAAGETCHPSCPPSTAAGGTCEGAGVPAQVCPT